MPRAVSARTRHPRRGKGPHRGITSRCGSLFLRAILRTRTLPHHSLSRRLQAADHSPIAIGLYKPIADQLCRALPGW